MNDQPAQWNEQQRQQYYQRYRKYPDPRYTKREQAHARKKWLMILGMILIIVIIVGAILYISLREQPVPALPVETVTEPAVEQGLRILKNHAVNDEQESEQRSEQFFVDDEVILYTHVEGFENIIAEDGLYDYWLQYGLLVYDSDNNLLQGLSNPILFESADTSEGPISAYQFTARLSTLNLPAGEYILRSIITDGLTNDTARSDYTIILQNPETIRISGPLFGVMQPTGRFESEKPEYQIGEEIHTFIQVRGFKTEDLTADVDLDILFYDHENGYLDYNLTNLQLYNFKEVETAGINAFNLAVNIPTSHLGQGYYWVEFRAEDFMTGDKHKVMKPVKIMGGAS